jgi:ketosteroid isomerase-like protein
MADDGAELDAVSRANRRFYEAFEAGDIDAMSDAWEHSERVACTHPGWGTLNGWAAVAGSWYALFHNGQTLQFIVTNEQVRVEGDAAWVTCDENILGDGPAGGTVAALNVFVRGGDGWRLVAHHGSPIVTRS